MPLVVVCGPPLSGKTTRSLQLLDHFKSTVTNNNHILINEETFSLDKKIVYSSSTEEKKARSMLMGALERHLDRNTIVIVDSLNYIKGFRYQLYCVARAVGTLHCVVYCSGNLATSQQRNETCNWYLPSHIEELYGRFEEPDSFARWDKPLFRVNPTDPQLPFANIKQTLLEGVAPPPNLSTVVKPVTDLSYLQQLDCKTKSIVDQLSLWLQQGNVIGTAQVLIDATKQTNAAIQIKKRTSQNELLRLQKHFIQINKVHNLDVYSIPNAFIEYLNKSFAL